MSADARTVTTDALETLGMIIGEGEKRDAIHLAVEPVIAGHPLSPGQDVGFIGDGIVGASDKPLGIVDPFLKRAVLTGERFWLVVYPRQIRSLRHVWEHPDFAPSQDARPQVAPSQVGAGVRVVSDAETSASSRKWIEDYAASLGSEEGYDNENWFVTADELIEVGKHWVDKPYDKWLIKGGLLEGERMNPEFWDHFEVVTGLKVPNDNRDSFFSCSC